MKDYARQMKNNHQKFLETSNPVEKLIIGWDNTLIQLEMIKEAQQQIKNMALDLGYEIDENTGLLKKKQ